jgi:geranyl-CoA carboxylase alpha subunit
VRTARRLGYQTVAVYSEVDKFACHVDAADQAVCIGGALPSQSYLNVAAVIEAARLTGADAVHPGYGFLAENDRFAEACQNAGLVFVGPSPRAIRAMGDKAGAKRLMLEAGVPCIPGYQSDDQSEKRLAQEAERIGFPVMIKASAGGGGRGMRRVNASEDFLELLRSAQSEARNAFGDATVILERAIVEPRHIEVQVFADRHGGAVHLGERDCSVQRRHQKVIEEAPSPAVDASLRARMGATAVAAIKAIGYEGAGTLEFLLERNGSYYFMEMNTRLQVEHPVTESITGLDLVEWQLRVAAGEPLPLQQDEITFSGHAIEVRLCAEDVALGFMPQSGEVRLWKKSVQLRVEHALATDSEIPPYYDSMIAKLIAHGPTRGEALRRLSLGLQETAVLGVCTNRDFLIRCVNAPVFAQGLATTAFISQCQEDLLAVDEDEMSSAEAICAAMIVATVPSARKRDPGRRLTQSTPLTVRQRVAGRESTAVLHETGPGRHRVQIGERTHDIEIVRIGDGDVRFICNGVREGASWVRTGNRLWISLRRLTLEVSDNTRVAARNAAEAAASDGKLRASMNGRVVNVLASVGQAVQKGQPLVTLEAMKMEHMHTTTTGGVVRAVQAAVGDQVTAGQVLVELEAEASAP